MPRADVGALLRSGTGRAAAEPSSPEGATAHEFIDTGDRLRSNAPSDRPADRNRDATPHAYTGHIPLGRNWNSSYREDHA